MLLLLLRPRPLPPRVEVPHNAPFDLVVPLLPMPAPLAAELRLRSLLVGASVGRGHLEKAVGSLPSEIAMGSMILMSTAKV
jgi:hypothetical protein